MRKQMWFSLHALKTTPCHRSIILLRKHTSTNARVNDERINVNADHIVENHIECTHPCYYHRHHDRQYF